MWLVTAISTYPIGLWSFILRVTGFLSIFDVSSNSSASKAFVIERVWGKSGSKTTLSSHGHFPIKPNWETDVLGSCVRGFTCVWSYGALPSASWSELQNVKSERLLIYSFGCWNSSAVLYYSYWILVPLLLLLNRSEHPTGLCWAVELFLSCRCKTECWDIQGTHPNVILPLAGKGWDQKYFCVL